MKLVVWSILVSAGMSLTFACSGGRYSIEGNQGGSDPINETEAHEIQRAVNRCHKTGGTRVVKVQGELRCY